MKKNHDHVFRFLKSVSVFFCILGETGRCHHCIPAVPTIWIKCGSVYYILRFFFFLFFLLLCYVVHTEINTGLSLTTDLCLHPLGCWGNPSSQLSTTCPRLFSALLSNFASSCGNHRLPITGCLFFWPHLLWALKLKPPTREREPTKQRRASPLLLSKTLLNSPQKSDMEGLSAFTRQKSTVILWYCHREIVAYDAKSKNMNIKKCKKNYLGWQLVDGASMD